MIQSDVHTVHTSPFESLPVKDNIIPVVVRIRYGSKVKKSKIWHWQFVKINDESGSGNLSRDWLIE